MLTQIEPVTAPLNEKWLPEQRQDASSYIYIYIYLIDLSYVRSAWSSPYGVGHGSPIATLSKFRVRITVFVN
jgi:hypothetical protein